MLTLKGGRVITPFRILDDASITCNEARIVDVSQSPAFSGMVIDVSGTYLMPGFIDSHVHGGGGFEFWTDDGSEILRGAEFLARHGTTSFCPSVNYGEQMVLDTATRNKLAAMKRAMASPRGATILGLHLEGPHISQAHPMIPNQPLNPAIPSVYRAFLAEAPHISKWTVAPEVAGVPELIDELLSKDIVVSLGHSNARLPDIYPAYEKGVRSVTHIYSGMSTISRANGRRLPGLLEAALFLDEMTVELIANKAHLPAELIQHVWRTKGPEHICVVSDSTAATGMPDGEILYRGQPGYLQDGAILKQDRSGFLGAAVTSDVMFQNLVLQVGIPMMDAVRMCSTTPARVLGLGHRKGVIAPGFDADIVAFDSSLQLRLVVIAGKVIYNELP